MGSSSELGAFSGESGVIDTESLFSQVLLVEDDAAHAKLISRALAGVVGDIEHASSGAKALELLETSLAELVLCDLNLPDMSGVDLLAAVRNARPGLPVIVMTSSNSLEDAVSAMRAGAWDYMVKQFSESLADRMRLVIERTAERKLNEMRELKIRAERDAFWAAAHTAPDGLAIIDGCGNIAFSNQMFDRFSARISNPDTTRTENLVRILAEHDDAVANELRTQLESHSNESLWSTEFQLDADGEVRHFALTLSSVQLGSLERRAPTPEYVGSFRRYVVWVRDITRRKEQEKFQRDLLSTTTHDLKGPLGAILNSTELMTSHFLDDKEQLKQLITRVSSCARNSITLIDELLSARRIQDGVLVVNPKWYDLKEILEDTILDYIPMARAKSIDFTYRIFPDDLKIYADKLGLNRVMGNLVSNALKFTPKGGQVSLSAGRIGDEVHISVSDTGPGIESKARHLLFERYGRLDTHQEVEGTGLGLFVAKNIVDSHSGTIKVMSEVGVGTTFIVSFPDEREAEDSLVDNSGVRKAIEDTEDFSEATKKGVSD